jgi:hypothetical protein
MSSVTYPAVTSAEAVALTISNANQLHKVVNGNTEETIETYEGLGNIPSVAKALRDAAAYKVPLDWLEGGLETELLQPRTYLGNLYVPLMVPAAMGVSPTSTSWRLYAPLSRVVVEREKQLGSDITANISLLTTIKYVPGDNNLDIFVDGARADLGSEYLETSPVSVTWLVDIPAEADIVFLSGKAAAGNIDIDALEAAAAAATLASTEAQTARDEAVAAAASIGGLTIKSVVSPYTLLTEAQDNDTVLVFDSAAACTINLPEGLTVGTSLSYRNKQGGVITLTPTGAAALEGAGNTTTDSTKANSLYVESTNLFVSVGDLTTV